jgi:hypothetical protein
MAIWEKGQPYRIVHSLEKLNEQIRSVYPRAVPPATDLKSWGALADDAHATSSDHYPHFYGVLGGIAVVCARDFPHAPGLGLDTYTLAEKLRQSGDPRIGYVISNKRKFYGRVYNGIPARTWMPHSGDDPHNTHIHISTVHTALADSTAPWIALMNNGGRFMPELTETEQHDMYQKVRVIAGALEAVIKNLPSASVPTGTPGVFASWPNSLKLAIENASNTESAEIIVGVLQGLADDPNVDVSQVTVDTIASAVVEKFRSALED